MMAVGCVWSACFLATSEFAPGGALTLPDARHMLGTEFCQWKRVNSSVAVRCGRRPGEMLGGAAMPMAAGDIERLIKASIPDAQVTIRDLAGDGDHYAATVISAAFKGKSRVQQHQLVYNALKAEMGGALHALALQTGVPE
jgi:stress-induced morphogen